MILTMILAGGAGERLYPLTKDRTKPAVPFGGTYRIIDFTLSNCVNSGLRQIYVLTQYKSDSLIRHLYEGWNIFRSELGEFIFPIPAQQRVGTEWYKGTADAVRQNLHLILERNPEHVLIPSGDHIYKMNYQLLIDYHRERNADLTVATIELSKEEAANKFGVIEVDEDYKMIGFEEKPSEPKTIPSSDKVLASMGVYIFNTDILVNSLTKQGDDFGKDIIPKMIGEHKVSVYNYMRENRIRDCIFEIRDGVREKTISDRIRDSSYWRDIGTIQSYHDAHMDLVGVDPALDLYGYLWPLRTLRKQYPPAKLILGGTASDSIISDGCIISGGIVIRSVLSPGVIVERDAIVEESVLLDDVEVGSNAKIKRAIIDKSVKISPGTVIGYDLEEDAKRFTVDSGIVVIEKGLKI